LYQAQYRAKKHAQDRAKNRLYFTLYRRKYRKTHKLWKHKEQKARAAVYRAIRFGNMTKSSCRDCKIIEKVQAHHPNYDRPLDVIWLCQQCHRNEHRK
jgi:hypothetical protein